jgi:hydrogenase 3 maturation protease
MTEVLSDIKTALSGRLRAKRVTLVGIGNIEKGDDGFGIHFIRRITGKLKVQGAFDCGLTPENYLGPIVRSNPEAIVLVDVANIGAEPGHTHIIEKGDIASLGLSTHDASLNLFIRYLENSLGDVDIFLVGVQPRSTELGSSLSPELEARLSEFETIFCEILS